MNINTKRGFTLIELLVVIAIIGILASVVLASLNNARSKGADAAVKSNLNGVRAQAELVYDDTGSYATVCDNANVLNAKAAADSANGTGATPTCVDQTDSWAMSSALVSTGAGWYCVDSTGDAGTTSANTISATSPLDTDCD